MTIDLKVLADHRDALLLAEVAAWLHNIGKMSEEFLRYEAKEMGWENYDYQAIVGLVSLLVPPTLTQKELERLKSAIQANSEAKTSGLLSNAQKQWLQERNLVLPEPFDDHKYALGDWIEFQDYGWYKVTKGGSPPRITLLFPSGSSATKLLEASHNAASKVEKEGTPKDEGKQTQFPMYIATAFGNESEIMMRNLKTWRDELLDAVRQQGRHTPAWSHLENAVGDTRRPINEVRLSDLSFSVVSLFKSAMAQAIVLQKQISRDDLHWRLLRVNFDVLSLYAKAVKIGDLLGYKRAVEQACEAVKKLIEEEYPLGNEIYRDSSGIYFTFPDLELPSDLKQEVRRRVEALEMELAPRIDVTVGEGNTAAEQLKGILGKAHTEAQQELKQPFDAQNINRYWQDKWEEAQREPGKWEVCQVCGLRPKREDREVCTVCENRRKGRLSEWLETLNNPAQPQPTIWTNEVADKNGRLALLLGKFDLEDWLCGDLVQTMLVRAVPNKPGECTPKNPSPARLRRIWTTTQRFWESALDEIDEHGEPLLPLVPHRLILAGNLQREADAPDPQEQPICELLIEGFKLSVVWHAGQFIVCDNPAYFQTITGKALADVLQKGASFWLSTSEGYKKKDQKIGKFTIGDEPVQKTSYRSFIPILTEPQIFMALVPADRVLPIVQAIRRKYEREMGKVQNRLPLHLGVVFAGRRMPLQAILDAGRAMRKRSVNSEQWTVVSNSTCEKRHAPDHLKTSAHFEQWQEVRLKNDAGREITLPVSIVMGDGATEDLWYPYFELCGAPAAHHLYCFEQKGKRWVHVKNLLPNDKVFLIPSTFDFEFLDTASRRFEVYYDEKGRRLRRTRPFFLQDVERLESLWKEHFSRLKRSQFSKMLQTIEAARERWNIPLGDEALKNDVFRRFVKDTLANARWDWKGISEGARNQLILAAVCGELADWAEIHLEILKEAMEGEQS